MRYGGVGRSRSGRGGAPARDARRRWCGFIPRREYLVYFLGFSPGFPYLGGMPPEIATPRLATPRRMVPAGSVAIGGDHTGIYPWLRRADGASSAARRSRSFGRTAIQSRCCKWAIMSDSWPYRAEIRVLSPGFLTTVPGSRPARIRAPGDLGLGRGRFVLAAHGQSAGRQSARAPPPWR